MSGGPSPTVRKANPVVLARVVGDPRRVDTTASHRPPIGATELKVFTTLLARAFPRLHLQSDHTIDWADLVASVGYEGNPARVERAIETLWSTPIAIDIDDEDGKRSIRCHYLSYEFTRRDPSRGRLDYAFGPRIKRYLHHPKVYSLIHLQTSSAIKDGFALRLYEILCGYVGRRDRTWSATVEEFRSAMDVAPGVHERFGNLNGRKVRPAVDEINEKSEMIVDYVITKGAHGRATGIRFTVSPKAHPAHRTTRQGLGARRRDAGTPDLLTGMTDAEAARTTLRSDTMTRAVEIAPEGENVFELHRRWITEMPDPGPDPDEAFLAWVRLRAEAVHDEAMGAVDVDAVMAGLLAGGER